MLGEITSGFLIQVITRRSDVDSTDGFRRGYLRTISISRGEEYFGGVLMLSAKLAMSTLISNAS